MQDVISFTGQSMVYEEAAQLIRRLIGLDVNAMQIQRISLHYGQAMEQLIASNCKSILPTLTSTRRDDPTYVMMDGSMVFTRADNWKEMKLGVSFHDSQIIDIQSNRRQICRAVYVSHLGSVGEFFPKFERHLVSSHKKVIIGDGAKWIWNWAEDNYPGAIQILDFYHAKEKLVLFAKQHFKEESQRFKWLDKQQASLLNNEVEKVIKCLQSIRARPASSSPKQQVIKYFLEHEDRMQYKTYLESKLLIGSGPIEAAHRSVIQQRMKLSGQKWSLKGANAIATLRCYNKSNAWVLVTKLIKAAA